ncbi:hypothetical protein H4R33_003989, partial [Dimargaris cristalligena]
MVRSTFVLLVAAQLALFQLPQAVEAQGVSASDISVPAELQCYFEEACSKSLPTCAKDCLKITMPQYTDCYNNCMTTPLNQLTTNTYILQGNCFFACVDNNRKDLPFNASGYLADKDNKAMATPKGDPATSNTTASTTSSTDIKTTDTTSSSTATATAADTTSTMTSTTMSASSTYSAFSSASSSASRTSSSARPYSSTLLGGDLSGGSHLQFTSSGLAVATT